MLSETSFLDVEMISVFYARPAAIRGILRALSDDLPMVWFGVFPVRSLENSRRELMQRFMVSTIAKTKHESNATLQFSTEHKTNKEKPCQSVIFGVFRLLLFWGKKAVFALPRLQDE